MATLAKLVVELVGDTAGFASSMDGARGIVDRASSGMVAAGGRLTAGVTAPILAIGAAALAIGNQYDGAMDTIQTTTGATGATLAGLGQTARDVFTSIPTDIQTASEAVSELYQRTGQTGEGLQDLAAAEVELARITAGDLNTQIAATTRLFGDWGIEMEDQVPSLDKLLMASQQTGIGVDTLAQKLVQFGAPLRQMGFSFEASTALIAKFEEEGVNTELVLGSLRIALGKMAKAGIEPHEGLQMLISDIQGAGSTAEANKIAIAAFGARAGPDMAAAIREGRFEISDFITSFDEMGTTIMGTAASTNDFAENLTVLKNQAIDAAQPLAVSLFQSINNLMPVFKQIIGFVTGLIDRFTRLPQGVQTAILVFVALVAALGPVLMVLGTIIPAIGAIGGAFGAIAGVIGGVAAAIGAALGPVLVIIAVIAAAVVAFKLAWDNNFLGIRDTIQAVFAQIREIVSAVMSFLRGEISFEDMVGRVSAAWDNICRTIGRFLDNIVEAIIDAVARFIAPLVGGFDNARGMIAQIWEGIKRSIEMAWEFIKGIISAGVEAIRGIIAVFVQILSGDWSGAWETIKATVIRVWDEIKTGISNVLGVIGPAIANAWDGIKTAVTDKVDAIKTAIADKWEAIKAGASEKWEAVKERITTIVGGIRDFVVNVLGDLVSKAIELFGKIIAAITGKGGGGDDKPALTLDLSAMVESLRQARAEWEGFQTFVRTVTTAILATVIAWLSSTQTVMQTTWTTIQATFTLWLATQLALLQANLLMTQTAITVTWTAIQTLLLATWQTIQTAYTLWLATQLALLQANLLLTQQAITVTWTEIQTFLIALWAAIKQQYFGEMRSMLATTRQINQWMLQDFRRVWPEIQRVAVDNALQMRDRVVAAFNEMKSQVLAVLAAMEAGAHAAGVAIGNAVAAGIYASIPAAVAAARALAAAVDAVLPHSDAKKGPLSHLSEVGPAIVGSIADGIVGNLGQLTRPMLALANKLDVGTGTGLIKPVNPFPYPGAKPVPHPIKPFEPVNPFPYPGAKPGEGGGTGTCVTINIYNPTGQPAERDVMRVMRNISALGVLPQVRE